MELTDSDLAAIHAENLRVPRAEFIAVWAAAEAENDRKAAAGVPDWPVWGVVSTCRWLARAVSRSSSGRRYMALGPVTRRPQQAMPELIEQEYLAADSLLWRRPVPRWVAEQPGWLEAVVATLDWAWRRSGRPPISVGQRQAS